MRFFGAATAGIILLSLFSKVQAAPENLLEKAQQLAKHSDYKAAQKLYEQALKQDSENALIRYNLAVVDYRLKDYTKSRELFTSLLHNPKYAFLARYNLGLIANKTSSWQETVHQFKQLISAKPLSESDRQIQRLAERQLAVLKTGKPVAKKNYQVYLNTHLGYDDHLVDPSGLSTTGDLFTSVITQAWYVVRGDTKQGLRVVFDLYSKQYTDLNNYNYQQYGLSLVQHYRKGDWRYKAGVMLGQSTYGPDDYLDTSRLELSAQYQLDKKAYARGALQLNDYQSRNVLFDPYAGQMQRLKLDYNWRSAKHQLQPELVFEWNDRADVQNGTDYISYSATRQQLGLSWTYKMDSDNSVRLRWSTRSSDYNDLNTLDGVIRSDELDRVEFQYKSRISGNWWLAFDYKQSDNESNIARYGYSRNITTFGVSGLF